MKVAVFPGSFDPITNGHLDIIQRAMPLFDKIVIAVGQNATKSTMFTIEQRMKFIADTFASESKIEVVSYSGLTIDFAKQIGAEFMLRGIRNPSDFEFEKSIAQANRQMQPDLETVFFLTSARFAYISSSIVRDVIKNKGDYSLFVPDSVKV